PTSMPLIDYKRYFDVINDDPEIMGSFDEIRFNHAQFHAEYACKALREKRIKYSKANPTPISNENFINEIIKRTTESDHLRSFKIFLNKLNDIKLELGNI
ncbi:hypothetical protein, partial [Shewanella sp.]